MKKYKFYTQRYQKKNLPQVVVMNDWKKKSEYLTVSNIMSVNITGSLQK